MYEHTKLIKKCGNHTEKKNFKRQYKVELKFKNSKDILTCHLTLEQYNIMKNKVDLVEYCKVIGNKQGLIREMNEKIKDICKKATHVQTMADNHD